MILSRCNVYKRLVNPLGYYLGVMYDIASREYPSESTNRLYTLHVGNILVSQLTVYIHYM
jgi:hypothetical protein